MDLYPYMTHYFIGRLQLEIIMDITSIRYFVELAKNRHFTKTAQKLYISQQNLSQHIKKLEDYCGTPLFIRKPQLTLTQAGQEFFEASVKIINEEDNILNRLHDMVENSVGTLYIGASQYRGQYWLPIILPNYMKIWPNVTINLTTDTSANMEHMLISGDLDFFIGIKQGEDPLLRTIPLMKDKVYLTLTKELLFQYFGENVDQVIEECKNGTTLDRFKDLPYIRLTSNYRLRKLVDLCFDEAGYKPRAILEVGSIELMLSLFQYNLGAFFCTGMRVPTLQKTYPNGVFLPVLLKGEYILSPLSIVYHKDRFFPKYAKDFMMQVRTLFASFEEPS